MTDLIAETKLYIQQCNRLKLELKMIRIMK